MTTKKVVKGWVHIKMTLGVDPNKYVHVLLPASTDDTEMPIGLEQRLSKHMGDNLMTSWSSNYRMPNGDHYSTLSGIDLIYDDRYKSVSDLVGIVRNAIRGYINDEVVILPDNATLFDWMTSSSSGQRKVQWRSARYDEPLYKRYLRLTETVEYYD